MILKEENKETTKKNKKGLYVAALCGVLAVSGAVYAATRGGTEPERNLVDLNEDPGTKQDTNPGLYTENNDGQQGELLADNTESGQEGQSKDGQDNPGSQAGDGKESQNHGNSSNVTKPAVTQTPVQAEELPEQGNVVAQNPGKPAVEDNKQPADDTPPSHVELPEDMEGKPSVEGEPSEEGETAAVINPTAEDLKFSEEEGLCWPLQGNVIKNYSADKMVYFETLQQFRTNPAIFISGEIGTDIVAAADGIVKEIRKEDKTGQTLVLDIGDGYCLVYGHLAEISAKEGDYLEAGAVFAKLAPVTRYYQIEGNHLYFQVQKDDETLNPMILIQ